MLQFASLSFDYPLCPANPKIFSPRRIELSDLQVEFEETVARHTAKHGFRTFDILHIAFARLLGCDHFFSFDERARKLAALEGFEISQP